MKIKNESHSDMAIPPGEFLEQVISELGMSKKELARRMNRPATKLSAIFSGEKTITSDTALQLEKVVGVPAHIWTGLEAEYRLTLARNQETKETEQLRSETHLVTKFCYAELAKMGLVTKKTKPADKVKELQRYFGVTALKNIPTLKRYHVIFRHGRHKKGERSPEAVASWLRMGELQGQQADCTPFDMRVLKNSLPALRHMTIQSPKEFKTDLCEILLRAGVVLVLCPHFPKTYANGATFWMGNNKAILMLTIRGSWADIFWFSLFHEIGHIILHGKQKFFLEDGDISDEDENHEKEADKFAAETLIPPSKYADFLRTSSFSARNIKAFAKSLHIDPGIVVGRLQHDKSISPSWHNNLRSRYEWKRYKI